MTLIHSDAWLTVHGGDCRDVLRELPSESVHCVITSPPYWGLRDYGTALWEGGDPGCDHIQTRSLKRDTNGGMLPAGEGTRGTQSSTGSSVLLFRDRCGKCGAIRQDAQLGLEKSPDEYVANLVAVFREVRRVLRGDGTCWLNLGDSYAGSSTVGRNDADRLTAGLAAGHGGGTTAPRMGSSLRVVKDAGLKPKDLVGVPWRVAFALQADGWYLRSDIIWSKPNPMPESVTDRPTKSHEYVFLLAKSARYFFDADAIRETATRQGGPSNGVGRAGSETYSHSPRPMDDPAGRNRRSVWTIATAPYPGAHFATFPPKLVEPMILAGTSERGVCPECGAPWLRVVERGPSHYEELGKRNGADFGRADSQPGNMGQTRTERGTVPSLHAASSETTGWRRSCAHELNPVPSVVMDPFCGTGTVLMVAQKLGRRGLGIDLNPEYVLQALDRNRQVPLGLGA